MRLMIKMKLQQKKSFFFQRKKVKLMEVFVIVGTGIVNIKIIKINQLKLKNIIINIQNKYKNEKEKNMFKFFCDFENNSMNNE